MSTRSQGSAIAGSETVGHGSLTLPQTSLSRPVSVLQACWLVVNLRLVRLRNRLIGQGLRDSGGRARSRISWRRVLSTVMVLVPFLALTALGGVLGRIFADAFGGPGADAAGSIGVLFGALLLVLFILSLSYLNRDLSSPTAEIERLIVLPTSLSTLVLLQLVERTLCNRLASGFVYPLLLAFTTRGALTWGGVAFAVASSHVLLCVLAGCQLLFESLARVWLSRRAIDNVQFLATILGLCGLVALPSYWQQALSELGHLPLPIVTTSVRLALSFQTASAASVLGQAARYVGEVAVLLTALGLLLRGIGNRAAMTGPKGSRRRELSRNESAWYLRYPTGVAQVEILRLTRDRKALYSALSLPLALLLQLVAPSPALEKLVGSSAGVCALAYCVGGLATLVATGSLQMDGRALWLSFTVPRSLTSQVAGRAGAWIPFGLLCSGGVFACWGPGHALNMELLSGAAYAVIGVCQLTLLGLGLSSASVDLKAIQSASRSWAGGRTLLWSIGVMLCFASGFYGPAWMKLCLVVLTSGLLVGVWQSAGQRLSALLDTSVAVPWRPGVAAGLSIAMVLMVLQQLGEPIFQQADFSLWMARGSAFLGSVAMVLAALLVAAWATGNWSTLRSTIGRELGARLRPGLHAGARWGVAAVGLAVVAYMVQTYLAGQISRTENGLVRQPAIGSAFDWIVVVLITCVGAPLVEETLFRGMIYRGLSHSLSARKSAFLSALLFAAIHPPMAWAPTLTLGLLAVRSMKSSQSLAAPMVVHVSYNATLVIVLPLLRGLL